MYLRYLQYFDTSQPVRIFLHCLYSQRGKNVENPIAKSMEHNLVPGI